MLKNVQRKIVDNLEFVDDVRKEIRALLSSDCTVFPQFSQTCEKPLSKWQKSFIKTVKIAAKVTLRHHNVKNCEILLWMFFMIVSVTSQ